jgi:hypothetical protein
VLTIGKTADPSRERAMENTVDSRQRFSAREIVRGVSRTAYIHCECDFDKAQRVAEAEAYDALRSGLQERYGSVIAAIIFAVIINLVSGWIADFLRDWLARGIRMPSANYQPGEPGYESVFAQEFEDDET